MYSCPAGCRAFLPLVAAGVVWCPNSHHAYLPDFRSAVRTMLLINNTWPRSDAAAKASRAKLDPRKRGRGTRRAVVNALVQRQQLAGGMQLPPDVLEHILQLAASPITTWVPELRPFSVTGAQEQLPQSAEE